MLKNRTIVWFMWGLVSLFYAYQYILRILPNMMMDYIYNQFNIDSIVFGQFAGLYYIGYALAHIPIGISLDRWGGQRVLPICVMITLIGLIPMIYSYCWVYALGGRFLVGVGSSGAILGALHTIRLCFEPHRFCRVLGYTVFVGLLGPIVGSTWMTQLISVFGTRLVILWLIVIGLLISVLMYITFPKKQDYSFERKEKGCVGGDVKFVLGDRRILILALSSGLIVGPMEGFSDAWGSAFLMQVYGLDSGSSQSIISNLFLGMLLGTLILPTLSDITNRHMDVVMASGVCMLVCFVWMLLSRLSQAEVAMTLFVVGVCCAYQVVAVDRASSYVPVDFSGLTAAIVNMVVMTFGYGFHASIGWVAHIFRHHPQNNLFYAVQVIPFGLILGTVGFIILRFLNRKDGVLGGV